MDTMHRPTKEQVRQWLQERRQGNAALPDREQIRRQLGWELICVPLVAASCTPVVAKRSR